MARLAPKDEQLIDRYLKDMRGLPPALRQELGMHIWKSLPQNAAAATPDEPAKSLLDFAGVWRDDAGAAQIEEAIKAGRSFGS